MENVTRYERNASLLAAYRRFLVWCLIVMLVAQVVLVTTMSLAGGWIWYWVLPILIAVLLPQFRERKRDVFTDDGFAIGPSESLSWGDIDRVERSSDFWLVFLLRNGQTRILLFEDWTEAGKEALLGQLRSRELILD